MIVIPMAGESARFRRAGYDRPKYMLDLAGRPLFDWTVLSFAALFGSEPFLFVARDVDGTADFLRERIALLGLARAEVVYLEQPTRGQADTVAQGLQRSRIDRGDALTIFNIDTIRPGWAAGPARPPFAGWLEVFRGSGDAWSFVDPDPTTPGRVRRTSEKVRISDLCCTGLYGFRSERLFAEALAMERRAPQSSEEYIAPIYNHLIGRGHDVAWSEIGPSAVMFAGVPDEYETLRDNEASVIAAFEPYL